MLLLQAVLGPPRRHLLSVRALGRLLLLLLGLLLLLRLLLLLQQLL